MPTVIPWIIDTTLRDGEQAPGVVFSLQDRLAIVEAVAACGVQEIEAGTPAMGLDAIRSIRCIAELRLPVRISAWCRARECDIDASARSGADTLHVSLPASRLHQAMLEKSEAAVLALVDRFVQYARQEFDTVSLGAQDASRGDMDFLRLLVRAARDAKADRLRYADTVGVLDPLSTAERIGKLVALSGSLPIGFHGHNDLGMATGNSISALSAGACSVDVTVNGLGERAGNAALAEVLMSLRLRLGADCPFRTEGLTALSELVAKAAKRAIPVDKPVVGSGVFRHESGIHVDGILTHASTYEAFSPELCGGAAREVVIGSHSGTGAVVHALAAMGQSVNRPAAAKILKLVRIHASRKGRSLYPEEVLSLWRMTSDTADVSKAI